MKRIHSIIFALLLAASGAAPPALAVDYQLHGFAAQGYSLSEGNDLYGSSRDGSFDLYELGLNGTVAFTPALIASAQILMRDAGHTDDEGLRLDYALLDYQFLSGVDGSAGLRLGRVKNPIGLYNETRDMIFTRPGILLPQSVYLDGVGIRGLLFSSDGGQVYGSTALGDHELSAVFGFAPEREARSEERRVLSGGASLGGDLRVGDLYFGRLQDEWGSWHLALSYVQGGATLEQSGIELAAVDAEIWVASLRYVDARYSVTGEYALLKTRGQSGGMPIESSSDGAYLQFDYRLTPQWTAYTRLDATFSDRDDRSGRRHADLTGQDRGRRYAYDGMLGLQWLPDAHWGFWAEGHLTDGAATVSGLDNNGTRDSHWSALLLMVGYRF